MNEKSYFKKRLESSFCADCNVNWQTFLNSLRDPNFPDRESEFKKDLAEAIAGKNISPEEFERLTDIELNSQEEIRRFLIDEIWQPLYGDEPIEL